MKISSYKVARSDEGNEGRDRCIMASQVGSVAVDETTLVALVTEYQMQMIRIARRYVDDPEIAQ